MTEERDELAELISSYLKTLPEKMFQIKECYQKKDWQNLKTHVHKLCGSAGLYGFEDLCEYAERLERAIISEDFNVLGEEIKHIDIVVDETIKSELVSF
jgi:HPt (histidine-containing phosphotransfer) domain-containing protein